ncbi:hypothetical protein ACIA6D_23380 [Streptomyces cacaoi]
MIQPGQTYRSCSPRLRPERVHVTAYHPETRTVTVVDYATFSGPRDLPESYFHDSPLTRGGTPRRTGYALEQP